MNERIREIAHEAGLPTYNPKGIPTKLEKFAELIIADCIDAVYGEGWDEDYYTNRIRRHFGMEEKST